MSVLECTRYGVGKSVSGKCVGAWCGTQVVHTHKVWRRHEAQTRVLLALTRTRQTQGVVLAQGTKTA